MVWTLRKQTDGKEKKKIKTTVVKEKGNKSYELPDSLSKALLK